MGFYGSNDPTNIVKALKEESSEMKAKSSDGLVLINVHKPITSRA